MQSEQTEKLDEERRINAIENKLVEHTSELMMHGGDISQTRGNLSGVVIDGRRLSDIQPWDNTSIASVNDIDDINTSLSSTIDAHMNQSLQNFFKSANTETIEDWLQDENADSMMLGYFLFVAKQNEKLLDILRSTRDHWSKKLRTLMMNDKLRK